ncbi:MAG: arginine--tRNA ligase [Patescibacteria group bacterium]
MLSEKIKTWLGDERAQVMPTENLANGDYASNLALVTKQDASVLKARLEQNLLPEIEKIEVAGGFLNFFLKPEYFAQNLQNITEQQDKFGWNNNLEQKKIIVEYTDPNPFKEFHIGHLMSNAIGESISRLIEANNAEVKRACYQGDVGLHVAKAIWGYKKGGKGGFEFGKAYALGSSAYENEEKAKEEIQNINQKIYDRSDPEINEIYDLGRGKSLENFLLIYEKLDTDFDFFFFESETGELGKKIVEENVGGIFEKSENAVVFHAEKFDAKLHTRVYITAQGLPTYEAKELGLHLKKSQVFPFDRSLIITANEQDGVFRVGLAALRQLDPELADKTQHLSHGMLRLPTGKMSSRTGDVITAESLIAEVKEKVLEKMPARAGGEEKDEQVAEQVAVGAIKYAILKQAPGRDVIFDFAKSLSFEGDSGPYLQYTYARAKSVLAKANSGSEKVNLENLELSDTVRLLARFPEIVARASAAYAPQLLLNYLINLASSFNSFYAQNKIIGGPEEKSRLALTQAVAQVMKNGLWLLGIQAPEKM